ncbi:MAG TPA: GNAT family N-acetyltransferase [Longimicrobiales bacterium]
MASLELVERVANEQAGEVVSVFCDAFYYYPVFRYVLGADNPDYDIQLQKMIGLFVMARVLRNEPIFGIARGARLVGAATTSIPDDQPPTAEFNALRDAVWSQLGDAARARYERCVAAWQPLGMHVPQHHVNMIGVRYAFQKFGLAGRLMASVHEMSRASGFSHGVSLTTEDPQNVSFYEHLGYRIVGEGRITPEIPTWGFFRYNDDYRSKE